MGVGCYTCVGVQEPGRQALSSIVDTPARFARLKRRDGAGRRALLAVLAALVGGLLYFHALQLKTSSGRIVGIALERGDTGLLVARVTEGMPAAQAGLRAGDTIVGLGGVPVGRESEYDRVAASFRRGEPVEFHVLRDGNDLILAVTPGVPFPWDAFLLQVVVSLAYLSLALVAISQREGDLRARLLFAFAYLVAVEVALPSVVVGDAVLLAVKVCVFYLLSGVEMGLELHLASVIPDRQPWIERRRWVVPGFYAAGGLLAVFAIWSFLAGRLPIVAPPLLGAGEDGALLQAVLPIWAIGVALLVGSQALHHPSPTGRHQAGLVLLGVVPWMAYVVVGAALDLSGSATPYWVGNLEPFALLAYPVAVFVAIFRYQLFDLELVVRRSMVYATLTGLLVLLFYASVGAGGALVAQFFEGEASVWVIAGATLVLGLLFAPLHRGVQNLIERQFFPERLLLRQRLTALIAELATLGKLPLMGQHLVNQLRDIFAVRGATLLLAEPSSRLLLTLASSRIDTTRAFEASFLLSPDDPGVQLLARGNRPLPSAVLATRSAALAQRLEFFDAALAVPVLASRRLVGLLLLGEKIAGEKFRAEELELLELVSLNVGAVFENARLYESATFDGLTGLLRRERILEQLERELARALRYNRPLSVGMADIDHFKAVNDAYGHLVGDSLLSLVARTLSSGLRSTDAVGRYGGEEFLLLLPETDAAGALVVAEKLRHLVEGLELRTAEGDTLRATISIGLASLDELARGEPVTVATFIGLADARLLAAKRSGRNTVISSSQHSPVPS